MQIERHFFDSFKKGSTKGFRKIFDAFFEPLVQYAFSITREKEAAKDIAQQSLINLWNNRGTINFETFDSYLFVSVKNRSLNYLRDHRKWKSLEGLTPEQRGTTQLYPEDSKLMQQSILNSGIQQLPEKCRQVLLLSKIEGLTNQEIASELNISVKTVERHMTIARKKLKTHLEPFKEKLF